VFGVRIDAGWFNLAIFQKYETLSCLYEKTNELSLDKENTSYSDSLDALILSLKGYNIK
jgi:hypothetical protein